MKPQTISMVINGKRYDTEKAILIAGNDHWDGNNHDRYGRNTFLYRTHKGNYFCVHQTLWQGERDRIKPLTKEEAMSMFEVLTEHRVSFEAAFDVSPKEA